MPTPFETAAAMTSAAVDMVYGESFQLTGMKHGADVDSSRVTDPARPVVTVTGAYVAPAQSMWPHARGKADDNAHKVNASVPRVSIDTAQLPWPVMIFDRVTRLKTSEVFEVSKSLPDGVRRIVLYLTARKR